MQIQLPIERAIQLRSYAEREGGLGIVEAIGKLLHLAKADEVVPGFEIDHVDCDEYRFAFDAFAIVLSTKQLLSLSRVIDGQVKDPGNGPRTITAQYQHRELAFGRGRGPSTFAIRGTDTGTGEVATRRLTLDVASNLARQLRAALTLGPTQ